MNARARIASRRGIAAAAILAVLVAACGADPAPTNGPSLSAAPGTTGVPGESLPAGTPAPTPPTIDGATDDTEMVPTDPGEGDVPAAVPATAPVQGDFTTGPARDLVTGSADRDGGTIGFKQAGDPLDGLTIEVPAGTYDATVTFDVTALPVTSSTYPGITALSPIIRVDNGEVAASGDPILVTIPATVPDGATVSAFYHNADGSLDALPVVAQSPTGATFAAYHFSDTMLAIVDPASLLAEVDSGFRPGIDDWQFTNYGSWAAPNGHCEGQVVSAMWYYLHQRQGAGASPLYGLYDNNGGERTGTFWPDDSDGYRLASAVQASAIAVPKVYSFAANLDTLPGWFGYDAIRIAIGVTGEPQLIAITDSMGGHAHAIIAYRVANNRIFVADPNYPGRLRTIKYDPDRGVLGPYNSGDSAGSIAAGGEVAYTRFALVPKTASAADGSIAALWSDFEAGKIGGAAFPAYALEVWTGVDENGDDIWGPLENGYATPDEELRVRVKAPGGETLRLWIHRGTASKAEKWGTEVKVGLKEGANDLGFYIKGVKNGAWRYVDFERLTVIGGLIDINGDWTGTLTFTIVEVDEEMRAKAEEEGCDIAIAEGLKGKPIPITLAIEVDEEGTGTGTLVVDASAVTGEAEDAESEPVVMGLRYAEGALTFDLGSQCESDQTCLMTGTAARVNGVDTIEGILTVGGLGFTASAEWSVVRDE